MRIVTYNVRSGLGMDARRSIARVAEVLRGLAPDVVCLQELDRRLPTSRFADQPARLGKLLGMKVLFCPTLRIGPGEYGIAVATSLPILAAEYWFLPNDIERRRPGLRFERRALQRVVMQAPEGVVAIHNTHWSLNANDRLASAGRVAELIRACELPALLCGDLNAGAESAEVAALIGSAGLVDAGAGPTYPSDEPRHRIDYVLAGTGLEVAQVRVVDTQASDHRPVVADVRLGAGVS